jgi:riboflavin synthase
VFTGLVQELGTVAAVERDRDGARVTIGGSIAGELEPGDSVSVNGVCLTATAVDGRAFSAEVVTETLRRSVLGAAGPGARVNLELPLRPTDRFGGHIVQGHVDGVGTVREVREAGVSRVLTIEADRGLLRYVAEKGSIAVDGVSLTVSELLDGAFAVWLIPETLERTNLGAAVAGTPVNLEVDVVAKYVERLVSR